MNYELKSTFHFLPEGALRIFSSLLSTPKRVAAKTRNWAMVMRMLWSTSPCGGSNIAHTAMMPATIRATADRISLTVHMAQYIPGAGARDVPEVKVYDVLP